MTEDKYMSGVFEERWDNERVFPLEVQNKLFFLYIIHNIRQISLELWNIQYVAYGYVCLINFGAQSL